MAEQQVPFRMTFDPTVNAAYIQLADRIDTGGVAKMVAVDPIDIGGMVNIDLDDEGRIIGIEVLGATTLLPTTVMERFSTEG
jgi:uncharacterized protein YuzE